MDTGNGDTVMVAGRLMKQHDRLLHADWKAVGAMALDSRDYVVEKSNFKLPKI